MSLLYFSEDCPEGNPDLRARNLFHYKLEKKNGHTVLRVLRMRMRESLDKEDEITVPIALPPNTKSFCVESRHQKPKKNPFPNPTQLVTA